MLVFKIASFQMIECDSAAQIILPPSNLKHKILSIELET